tara:strand:- start:1967 stop:2617 length:651 start_codon:yes stop_codon:yes gene_type:complete
MKVSIYCIPGLGQDHRIFEGLAIPNADIHFLDWIEAVEGESMQEYAKRFAEQLPDDPNICLLGVSLGGIVSVEISRIRPIKKLYLISTVKRTSEMPGYMAWLEKLPSNSKNAAKFAIDASITLKPFYDQANAAGNELFHKMVKAASLDFINWGIKAIAQWNMEEELNCPFLHIHGTADLVFPIKNIHQAMTFKGGTHYMIYNNASDISNWIQTDIS